MDTNSCYTFSEDEEYMVKNGFIDNIAYVPYKKNGKIFIFKVKINKIKVAHDCSPRGSVENHRYFDFSIVFNKKIYKSIDFKSAIKDAIKNKRLPHFYDIDVVEAEHKIENYMYTPDFYSCFMPSGFLSEKIIYKSKTEALEYAKNNKIPKYFIYDDILKKYMEYALIIE